MPKRVRRPPLAKIGELRAEWGKLPHCKPDICYVWGDHTLRGDGRLLHGMFSGYQFSGGYLAELERRGYDLTTLKFSIQKKRTPDDLALDQGIEPRSIG